MKLLSAFILTVSMLFVTGCNQGSQEIGVFQSLQNLTVALNTERNELYKLLDAHKKLLFAIDKYISDSSEENQQKLDLVKMEIVKAEEDVKKAERETILAYEKYQKKFSKVKE